MPFSSHRTFYNPQHHACNLELIGLLDLDVPYLRLMERKIS